MQTACCTTRLSRLDFAHTPLAHQAIHPVSWLQAEQEEADDGRTRPKVRRTQVVASEAARARHEGAQAALDARPGLSDAEVAAARRTLVESMRPRESVMQALTRLSARPRDAQVRLSATCVGGTARHLYSTLHAYTCDWQHLALRLQPVPQGLFAVELKAS
jgi:hypothetical protein